MSRRKKWFIGLGAALAAAAAIMFVTASVLAKRFEPYIRQRAIDYLSRRFQSEVEVGRLSVDIPRVPPLRLFLTRGKGVIAQVTGENIVLRHHGRRDIPPMFAMKHFHFDVDLGRVFDPAKSIALVSLDHMEIHIPPKGDRPDLAGPQPHAESIDVSQVVIERVIISDSRLVILPRDKTRKPLEFELHRVVLDSVQAKESLRYEAALTNPKPPGMIQSKGNFGPWNADSPSDSALAGEYTFADADLSVFRTIAGTLQSKGSFSGTLGAVAAKGEADVPDFRLAMSGHPVPLHTEFEALVDGTNGDTTLKPVRALLNTTAFTTSGAVLKHEGDRRRTIALDVFMPNGELMDLLRLAMKAKPAMAGRIQLTAKILIPPREGRVKEKLILDGKFKIRRGQFLRDTVQDKVDSLSRRGQGQPQNESIGNVFSDMAGTFHLQDQSIRFDGLTFGVPGAGVQLAGTYDLGGDELDFKGSLSLDAKVSRTMSGWKRWLLKPVDPFLSRNGAGTFLKITVTGSSKDPQFGASR